MHFRLGISQNWPCADRCCLLPVECDLFKLQWTIFEVSMLGYFSSLPASKNMIGVYMHRKHAFSIGHFSKLALCRPPVPTNAACCQSCVTYSNCNGRFL